MPKLLWMSPFSLHDDFSSAAINCKNILEGLANAGWDVCACSSFILEEDATEDEFASLKDSIGSAANQVLELDSKQVHYVYVRSRFHQEDLLSLSEMQAFYDSFCQVLDNWEPDFVLGFGTCTVFQACMAEAKRRGIWTLYMLLNGNHQGYNFPNIDFILTNSQANAQLYFNQDRTNAVPIGEAFDIQQYLITQRTPKYITFFNPALEMGLSFFAPIALAFQKLQPEQRFLVVSYQGNFAQNLHLLQNADGTNALLEASQFTNVDLADRRSKIKAVFEMTKVVLMPTLWWESWGRFATAATLNEIPVVASNVGGLVESTGGAGIHVPMPQVYTQNYLKVPSADEIKLWIEALQRALSGERAERIAKAKLDFALNRTIDRMQELLLPLYAQQRYRKIAYGLPEKWSRFGRIQASSYRTQH